MILCVIKTHTRGELYYCDHYNKAFSCIPGLKIHLWSHTGDTPYVCSHCDINHKVFIEFISWKIIFFCQKGLLVKADFIVVDFFVFCYQRYLFHFDIWYKIRIICFLIFFLKVKYYRYRKWIWFDIKQMYYFLVFTDVFMHNVDNGWKMLIYGCN